MLPASETGCLEERRKVGERGGGERVVGEGRIVWGEGGGGEGGDNLNRNI